MKGASKVIMGATLAMVVTLAIVLGLILVLLAELYCSLLLRRRQLRLASAAATTTAPTATTTSTNADSSSLPPPQQQNHSPPPPLPNFYAHGVLQAPRSLLFPVVSGQENKFEGAGNNQQSKLHHVLEIHAQESETAPQELVPRGTSPPCPSSVDSPAQIREIPAQISTSNASHQDRACTGDREHFVYISNPIYDNDASRPSRADTPFETPDSSPSRLETCGSSSSSSGDEEGEETTIDKLKATKSCLKSLPETPPLTPMKKLPTEACSVSLRDARSLGTSGSDSVSNNGLSSSSSGSPCTSPSW